MPVPTEPDLPGLQERIAAARRLAERISLAPSSTSTDRVAALHVIDDLRLLDAMLADSGNDHPDFLTSTQRLLELSERVLDGLDAPEPPPTS